MIKNKGALALMAALCLSGCGGGGGDAPVWTPIPDFTLSPSRTLMQMDSTQGSGAVQELQCTVTSHRYWSQPSHIAVILRYSPPPYPGLAGAGVALGRVGAIGDRTAKLFWTIEGPRSIIEVWAPGAGLQYAPLPIDRDSILPPDTLGPDLAEGVAYSLAVRNAGTTIRYSMGVYDSGAWADPGTTYDRKQTGILVALSAAPPGDWSIDFTGCRYRWSAE